MQPPAPHMTLDRVIMILAVLALSGIITFIEIMGPSMDWLKLSSKPAGESAQTTEPAKDATAPTETTAAPVVETPATQPAAEPTSPPVAKAPTATTVSFVHVRAGKSTNTPILFDLEGGVVVELRNDSDPLWQGVRYNGRDAYIYKSYLQY